MSPVLNRERALRLAAEAGIDVLVATSAQNVFYLTGYRGFVQHLMPATQVYGVVRLDDLDRPTLIAPIGDL
ncbi:MAG: aminopeptidase P family N-terminal domain-containing protein, partial [Solirubrobacteraceae bacterium]